MATKPTPFHQTGRAIKLLRTRADLTQSGLSEAAQITKAQISRYERGQQRPTLDSLDRILVALGVGSFELAMALQEVQHAVAVRGEIDAGEDAAGRWRAERRRARTALVQGFARYLEQLERSLEDEAFREQVPAEGSESPS